MVVAVKPRSSGQAASIRSPMASPSADAASNTTLPLLSTERTASYPSDSSTPRSDALDLRGSPGPIPRISATYVVMASR